MTIPPCLRPAALALVLALALPPMASANPAASAKAYDAALRRYEQRDLPGAAVELKNALQADGKNLAAHLLFGRVLMAMGELKAAEAAFEEALRQGVSKVEIAPLLGQTYLLLGEPKKLLDTITLTGLPQGLLPEILTLRGTAFAMSGNLTSASAAYAEARQLDPKSAAPLISEVPVLLRVGERERARTTALKATELAPDNAMAWYQLGSVQQTLGDRKGSLASFDKALALAPKLVDAHVARAASLLALGQEAEARKVLAFLKEEKVVEPRASYLRATLTARAGDVKAAQAEFNEAAGLIDSMAPGIRTGSSALLLAGALSHRAVGNLLKAREYLETLVARDARNFAGQMLLANILLESGELAKATPLVEGLLRAAPEDANVLYMMGSIYMSRRQFVQASDMFDRAAKAGTHAEALRELAFSQFGLGQDKLALANLEKVYAKNPRDLRAGIQLATTYARQGQATKAVQVAEAMIKLDPSNTAMIVFLGNVKGRLSDNKGMRAAFERALAIDPKMRQAIVNLAWLEIEEGRFDQARARLQAWVKETPKDVEAVYQLGVLERQAKRPTEAAAYFTKADEAAQKDPRPGVALVEMQLAQRRNDEALAAAKTLAGRFPEVIQVQLTLARAAMAAGDNAGARVTLQEASRLAGFDPVVLVSIGRLQLATGHVDGAAHSVNKALQGRSDDIGALILQVEVAARRGNAAEVDAGMKTLTAKHGGKVPTLMTAGHVAYSRRQLPQAIQAYRSAFDKEPGTPIALLLSQAHVANNEADKALALLEGLNRKRPGDSVLQRALAELQTLTGKHDAARRTYTELLSTDPNNASVLASLARLQFGAKDPAALATAEKAARLASTDTLIVDTYGWMLAQSGRLDDGIRVLREARLRDPGNGIVRWHLASALVKAGRKMEAKDELKAALVSNNPPPPGPELSLLKAEVGL